jgi:hypothetical protein
MHVLPATKEEKQPPDIEMDRRIEGFCAHIREAFPKSLTLERFAQEFRRYFHLPSDNTPVSFTRGFIEGLGICIEDLPLPKDSPPMWTHHPNIGHYTITLPYERKEPQVDLWHELFELLYWRLFYQNKKWASRFLAYQSRPLQKSVTQCHQLADRFAYAVAMPPHVLRAKALEIGYDILELANFFCLAPANILSGLKYYDKPACPICIIRLNFRNITPPEQHSLFFGVAGRQAEVWDRFVKSRDSKHNREEWEAVESLRTRCPAKGSVFILEGQEYKALMGGLPVELHTNTVLGIRLPTPVFVALRPNQWRSQMLVLVVPVGFERILKGDVRLLKEEEATLDGAASEYPTYGVI